MLRQLYLWSDSNPTAGPNFTLEKTAVMPRSQVQHPHFFFTVNAIGQSPEWGPRMSSGVWQPPRPKGSSTRLPSSTAGRIYEYNAGAVREIARPTIPLQEFRTYSFYCSNDNILIYPADATRHRVGDGSGNAPLTANARAITQTESSSDDSDEGEDDNLTSDWRSLTFNFPMHGDQSQASQARFRGDRRSIGVVRQNPYHIQSLTQLLPSGSFSGTPQIPAAQGSSGLLRGGLVGQLPVLIALVAYSVPPEQVHQVLLGCLRNPYVLHGLPPGSGRESSHLDLSTQQKLICTPGIDRRGLVVGVWHVQTAHRSSHGEMTPKEILLAFEEGRLAGYQRFVV